jgi:hypothetical protein
MSYDEKELFLKVTSGDDEGYVSICPFCEEEDPYTDVCLEGDNATLTFECGNCLGSWTLRCKLEPGGLSVKPPPIFPTYDVRLGVAYEDHNWEERTFQIQMTPSEETYWKNGSGVHIYLSHAAEAKLAAERAHMSFLGYGLEDVIETFLLGYAPAEGL